MASARREVRLSQRALAAELGVSLRTVQNYEAGKSVPYRHLDALSRLLERSPSWLLYGHEHEDADRLLAAARWQRAQLRRNLGRLRDLRARLADLGAQTAACRSDIRASVGDTSISTRPAARVTRTD